MVRYRLPRLWSNNASRPTLKHFKISILIHGWLNTGHQRKRMELDAKSNFPSCGQEEEHLLQCRSRQMQSSRHNSLVKLRSTIITKHGCSSTWTFLYQLLSLWMNGGSDHPVLVAPELLSKTDLHATLELALSDQIQIGWEMAFRGYLSKNWAVAQQIEHPRSTLLGIQQQWLRSVIQELWQYTFPCGKAGTKCFTPQQHKRPLCALKP